MTLTLCLTNDVAGDAYGDIMALLMSTKTERLTEMLKGMLHELELLESLGLSESDMPGAVAKLSQCFYQALKLSPGWLWLSAHTTNTRRKNIEVLWINER